MDSAPLDGECFHRRQRRASVDAILAMSVPRAKAPRNAISRARCRTAGNRAEAFGAGTVGHSKRRCVLLDGAALALSGTEHARCSPSTTEITRYRESERRLVPCRRRTIARAHLLGRDVRA